MENCIFQLHWDTERDQTIVGTIARLLDLDQLFMAQSNIGSCVIVWF